LGSMSLSTTAGVITLISIPTNSVNQSGTPTTTVYVQTNRGIVSVSPTPGLTNSVSQSGSLATPGYVQTSGVGGGGGGGGGGASVNGASGPAYSRDGLIAGLICAAGLIVMILIVLAVLGRYKKLPCNRERTMTSPYSNIDSRRPSSTNGLDNPVYGDQTTL